MAEEKKQASKEDKLAFMFLMLLIIAIILAVVLGPVLAKALKEATSTAIKVLIWIAIAALIVLALVGLIGLLVMMFEGGDPWRGMASAVSEIGEGLGSLLSSVTKGLAEGIKSLGWVLFLGVGGFLIYKLLDNRQRYQLEAIRYNGGSHDNS